MSIEDVIKTKAQLSIETKAILNIIYTKNLIADKFSTLLKPYGISEEQFNVLRILRGQKDKPANMCVIQERMLAKTSNTTRLVDKLLLKGLVTRNVCPDNRRKIEIFITQKGLELLTVLEPLVLKHNNLFTKNLTKNELEQLNILLEKIRTIKTEN